MRGPDRGRRPMIALEHRAPRGSGAPHMLGVRTRGPGTRARPCLVSTWPLRLTYEVRRETGAPGASDEPRVSFHVGDRFLAMSAVPTDLLDSGRLARAFSWPVTVAMRGCVEEGGARGTLYAITDCEDDPEWIELGRLRRPEAELRHPNEPVRELADLLLERLYGPADRAVERLLAGIGRRQPKREGEKIDE